MNKLVNMIKNKEFPDLFYYNELVKTGIEKKERDKYLTEAVKKGYIDNIYNNIFALSGEYRDNFVSEYVLAQMIDPTSYASLSYVLMEYDWIPDGIYTFTNVTLNKENLLRIEDYGSYKYKRLYNNIIMAGIKIEKDNNREYKIAKPLRALCDYLYEYDKLDYEFDDITECVRIPFYKLEDELKSEDFDELQGKLGISEIDIFLKMLRKELKK